MLRKLSKVNTFSIIKIYYVVKFISIKRANSLDIIKLQVEFK